MAYVPLTQFVPHFHKADGTLAVGCTLAAFEANTTTPQPFYLNEDGDEAGLVLTLNDRGEPEVSGNTVVLWRDTEVDYKFVFTDPADGQQWEVDDIISLVKQATESTPGIVILYDDVDSTDSTLAATANAVRIAYELAQQAIAIASAGVPVGSEVMWPTETPPDATWQECNGGSLLVAEYPEYYAVVGYKYGGSGANFNKPDWRGKFPRGWAHGSANDPDAAERTDRGDGTTGDSVGTNQADQIRAHTHSVTADNYNAFDGLQFGSEDDFQTGIGEFASGSTGGDETRPINMTRMIMAKVKSALD